MKISLSFKHIDSNEDLKHFVEQKCEPLGRYFKGQVSIHWTISAEKDQRIAHCHLTGNDMDYFGEGNSDDHKASIGIALDKIEKQLKKHKEIVQNHKNRAPTS